MSTKIDAMPTSAVSGVELTRILKVFVVAFLIVKIKDKKCQIMSLTTSESRSYHLSLLPSSDSFPHF